jgi:hypothetical protein
MSRRNAQHFEGQGEITLSPQPAASKLQEAILK